MSTTPNDVVVAVANALSVAQNFAGVPTDTQVIGDLQSQNTALQSANTTLQTQLTQANTTNDALTAEITLVKADLVALQNDLNKAKTDAV